MRLILAMLLMIVVLSSCSITGALSKEIKEPATQAQKDKLKLSKALEQGDISFCYSIQDQPIREECFIKMAEQEEDKSICSNLLGDLEQQCIENLKTDE